MARSRKLSCVAPWVLSVALAALPTLATLATVESAEPGVALLQQDDEKKAQKKADKQAKKEQQRLEKEERKAKKQATQQGKVVKARVVGTVASAPEAAQPEQAKTVAPSPAPKVASGKAAESVAPTVATEVESSKSEPAEPATATAERAAPAAAKTPRKASTDAPRPGDAKPAGIAKTSVPERASPAPRAARIEAAAEPVADVEPPTRPDVVRERVTVTEVLLDVLVTDKKGNVIEGLTASDFVIEEGGEQREVTSVTFYGGSAELSGSGVSGDRRTDRYFLLFFHDQAQAFPSLTAAQLDAGRWARRWIDQELQPNDQVAVLGYDVRLKLYMDFSRDREVLKEAISRAAIGKNEEDRGWRRSPPPTNADSPSLLANLPEGKELSRQTRKLQEALALVGRASEGIIGRKNLMLFSVGFGDILSGGQWHPDPRYYPDMKESLNSGNVAVYAIDTLGARGNPAARDINDSLSSLSSDTGGFYYWNFVNPLNPLRQVTKDNLGYYLLSYKTEYENGTSGYREVKVKAKDSKHKVRARKGYRYGA